MRISGVYLKNSINGLKSFNMKSLGKVVILAGCNGSGKSRLLKLIEQNIRLNKVKGKENVKLSNEDKNVINSMALEFRNNNDDDKRILNLEDVLEDISLVNYSHYDDPLQSPENFPPYVISMSKRNLEKCDFDETAREVLLYIQYLCKFEDEQTGKFEDFKRFILELSGIELVRDKNNNPKLFGFNIDEAQLSPGQQYLLRMCAALYCNIIENDNYILFLDEPETHLHPDAIWKLMERIRINFGEGQIWIATHSVALLSMFDPSDIWHFETEQKLAYPKKMGSKSASLIKDLLGDEARRFQLQQFISAPDAFACNEFAAECLIEPESVSYKKGDLQIAMIQESVACTKDAGRSVIVDFGAGKGRLLDGIGTDYPDILNSIDYYAYDKDSKYSKDCKLTMQNYHIQSEHYFNKTDELKIAIFAAGNADVALMVNVLHEIPPCEWPGVFKDIQEMLNDTGKLIIVEREELTYGEQPYDSGFLVIQEEAMNILDLNNEYLIKCKRHPERNDIVSYTIPQELLANMTGEVALSMVSKIGEIALNKIKKIKSCKADSGGLSNMGLKLAFWTHQFANAQLILHESG